MSSKITKRRWKELVKQGTLSASDQEEVLNFLKTLPKFSKQASKCQASVSIKNYRNSRGFSHRTLMLNGFIPLSQSAVFPQTKTTKTMVLQAARNVITEQILAFREGITFPTSCALTGEVITDFSQLDIDHRTALSKLCQDFLEENNLKWSDIKLKGAKNNKVWKCPKLRSAWEQYHHSMAILQVTTKSSNRSKGAK